MKLILRRIRRFYLGHVPPPSHFSPITKNTTTPPLSFHISFMGAAVHPGQRPCLITYQRALPPIRQGSSIGHRIRT